MPPLDKLKIPVIGSPLFIISNPDLVIAQCKAGIVGSFPCLNAREEEGEPNMLNIWLKKINEELDRYNQQNPDNEVAHQAKGIVLHDIINNFFAKKAIDKGADGLVAVASGAGGHAGTLSPFALIQEIREWFNGPLLLSGSIANGGAVLAAQAMGADLAYIGSAFIATNEANADNAYKQMITESNADDIVYTNLFTGVHGNYLKGSIKAQGLDPDNLEVSDSSKMNFSSGTSKPKSWKEIWGSGQGISAVKSILPASKLVERINNEYMEAKKTLI